MERIGQAGHLARAVRSHAAESLGDRASQVSKARVIRCCSSLTAIQTPLVVQVHNHTIMPVATSPEKLKIIVVGAGICGLACGAALREHADVTVSSGRILVGPRLIML
jgi:hypothetical protein